MKKTSHFSPQTKTFRLSAEERQMLSDLSFIHKTDESKILRAFLAIPNHYPTIHSALRQFL